MTKKYTFNEQEEEYDSEVKDMLPVWQSSKYQQSKKKVVEMLDSGKYKGLDETDSYGNVHALVGKVSFTEDQLKENIKAFMNIIIKSKPSVVKGVYVKNISLSTTMGPGIKLDVNSL